jgi:pyridoxine 4-dehydrogenase
MKRREMLQAAGAALLLPAFRHLHASDTSMNKPLPASAAGTVKLGDDLVVNRMGFGAMRITGEQIWGQPKDPAVAHAVLRRAVELGVNVIDTADAYGPAVSEQLIAEALHPYPAGLVIGTKGGLVRPSPSQWVSNGRPAHLRTACEASLTRLKLERIDLYQFHAPDPQVPFADSVGALAQLRREGKIRHVGLSNVDVAQLEQARSIVEIVSVQNRYNVGDRDSDPVLAACEKLGIAFLPWGPLGGRSKADQALAAIATAHGLNNAQVSLAWLLARSPMMLPIPGTSRVDHLEQDVAAAAVKLTREEMQRVG